MLNRRQRQMCIRDRYIDRVFTLETAIENGFGKVRVGDTLWRAKGNDLAAGTKVKVTAADGIVLVVEPAE